MNRYFRLYQRQEFEAYGRKSYVMPDFETHTEDPAYALVTCDGWWRECADFLIAEELPEDQQMALNGIRPLVEEPNPQPATAEECER